jgi:hypothetical protein
VPKGRHTQQRNRAPADGTSSGKESAEHYLEQNGVLPSGYWGIRHRSSADWAKRPGTEFPTPS